MSVELEKNTYGLSEGVFKACQFLDLNFPPEILKDFFKTCQFLGLELSSEILKKISKECQLLGLKISPETIKELDFSQEHVPSDYFGDDFDLDEAMITKLRTDRKWTKEQFEKDYKAFTGKFNSQKCFKHTKTDLNIYFCDYVLFANKQNGASTDSYFDFEFYKKSFEVRDKFFTGKYSNQTLTLYNDYFARELVIDKAKTNNFFADYLHREWIDTRDCTFDEFKIFVEKHPRFFSKPNKGAGGNAISIVDVYSTENLETLFDSLRNRNKILEEIVKQHESIASFCPHTVNTIRVNTVLDVHNVVHIMTTSGRFGRIGGTIDNFHGGGCTVMIDPITGIVTSDAINRAHERLKSHPDTGKTFKGFQYPCWKELCKTVTKLAKMLPKLRYIGWDMAVNDKGEIVLIEANGKFPGIDVQQAPDDIGKLYLYMPLIKEMKKCKWEQMKFLGWRVNNLPDFDSSYNAPMRKNSRLKLAMSKLIPDCTSLIDLGCRNSKFVKSICPKSAKYYPVDYKKHYNEVIVCDFNEGDFPDIKADTILCAFTAEYVELLPQFLASLCNAAQKQILMLCRPISEIELTSNYRWENPFMTDFTEEFLIKTMEQNQFQLSQQYPMPNVSSIILYDFRRI